MVGKIKVSSINGCVEPCLQFAFLPYLRIYLARPQNVHPHFNRYRLASPCVHVYGINKLKVGCNCPQSCLRRGITICMLKEIRRLVKSPIPEIVLLWTDCLIAQDTSVTIVLQNVSKDGRAGTRQRMDGDDMLRSFKEESNR